MGEKYTPKKGDRVRIVLEGAVEGAEEHGFRIGRAQSNWIVPGAEHVVSVEKLADPLPHIGGAVIRSKIVNREDLGEMSFVYAVPIHTPVNEGYWTTGRWQVTAADEGAMLLNPRVIYTPEDPK